MDNRAWLLAGLVLVAGVSIVKAVSGVSSRPGMKKGDRLLVMGDSLGVGLEPHIKGLAASDKELGIQVMGISVGGTATFQYAPSTAFTNGCGSPNCKMRLKTALESFKPTIVMISLGTNDVYGTIAGATIASSADEIVKLCQAAGAKVVWISPPKMQPIYSYSTEAAGQVTLKWRPEVMEVLKDTVIKDGVAWFDSTGLDLPRSDGLHPNAKAAAGWAANIWQWLTL